MSKVSRGALLGVYSAFSGIAALVAWDALYSAAAAQNAPPQQQLLRLQQLRSQQVQQRQVRPSPRPVQRVERQEPRLQPNREQVWRQEQRNEVDRQQMQRDIARRQAERRQGQQRQDPRQEAEKRQEQQRQERQRAAQTKPVDPPKQTTTVTPGPHQIPPKTSPRPPIGNPSGGSASGGTVGTSGHSGLEAARQQRFEALQQQRRVPQQVVKQSPPASPAAGNGARVDGFATPQRRQGTAAAGPTMAPPSDRLRRAITPVPEKTVLSTLAKQPPPTVGVLNANGAARANSLAGRKLTSAAGLLQTQYPPPPGLKGKKPQAGMPGWGGGTGKPPGEAYPGHGPNSSQPSYPQPPRSRYRIDPSFVAFAGIVSVLGAAYAAEIAYAPCDCLMRVERGLGTEEIYLSYAPLSEERRARTDSVIIYPARPDSSSRPIASAPASPGVVSPASSSPGGGSASSLTGGSNSNSSGGGSSSGSGAGSPPSSPIQTASITPPRPEDKRPAGSDSARATLGAVGGAAFEACTAAGGDSAKSPAAPGVGAADYTGATPAHFMLETGGHLAQIRSLVFTPGGKCLISAGDDKVIRIWSIIQRRSDRVLRGEIDTGAKGRIRALALSPDGTLLAAAGAMEVAEQNGHAIRLYDLRTGSLIDILIGHTAEVRAIAFSPDGRRLVSGGLDATAVLWDIDTMSPIQVLTGHSGPVTAVAFLPNGERIATAGNDKSARIWNATDGALLTKLEGHDAPIVALGVRKTDGGIVTAAQDGAVKLWTGRNNARARDVGRVEFTPGALGLLEDGKSAVLTCADRCRREFVQVIVGLDDGRQSVRYEGHDGFVHAAAVAADGRIATAGGTRHEIHVWSAEQTRDPVVLKGLGNTVSATGFYSDSRTIAWSYTFARQSHLVRGPMQHTFDLPLDGGSNLGEPLPFDKDAETGYVHAVDRLAEVSIAATATNGETSGAGSRSGGTGGSGGAGPRSAAIRVMRNGARMATISPKGGDSAFAYRAFSVLPSGEHIVAGGDDGLLEVYDLAGQQLVGYVGHQGTVWSVTPSPDGRLLASGGSDGTVRLWNAATGELVVSLFQAANGEWVVWTPQGYYAGSAGAGELIGWQVNRGPDRAADYVRAQQLRDQFHRPDVIVRAIVMAGAQAAVAELVPDHVAPEDILRQGVPPVVAVVDGDREATGGRAVIVVGLKENPLSVESVDVWVRDRRVTTRNVDVPSSMLREPGLEYRAFEVPMFSGENDVRVVARNEVGASDQTERGLSIRIVHNGEGALDKRGTLFALVVGVDKYPTMGNRCGGPGGSCDLQFAGRDAEGFMTAARSEMGRTHERVDATVLVNGRGADREPTLTNIKTAIERIRKQAGDNDTVVLFFAGHGLNGGGQFYFMPTDVRELADSDARGGVGENALQWREVQAVINQLGGRKLLFLDACHAGNSYYSRLGEDARVSRFIAFAAATGAQFAEEAAEVQHGQFTFALINGLKGEGTQQSDVFVYDFASFVSKEVIKRTKGRQTPEFFPTPGEGNFALVKRS